MNLRILIGGSVAPKMKFLRIATALEDGSEYAAAKVDGIASTLALSLS